MRRIIGTFADGFYCKAGLLLQELLARFAHGLFGAVSVPSRLLQHSSASLLCHTDHLGCTWLSDLRAAVLPGEFLPSTLVFIRTLVGY